MCGDRLSRLVHFEGLKLAAALVLLSPFLPLLFMGEEYGEKAPFPYFTSHSDPALVEAVRKGRQEEFSAFHWEGEIPGPQSEDTFLMAKLNHHLRRQEPHRNLLEFYRELIRLRKANPALSLLSKEHLEVLEFGREKVLCVHRWTNGNEAFQICSFNPDLVSLGLPLPEGTWDKTLDSTEKRWGGTGSPFPTKIASQRNQTFEISPLSLILLTRHKKG